MDFNRLFVDTHHPHLRFVGDQGSHSPPAWPFCACSATAGRAFDGTTGMHPSVFRDFRSDDLMAWGFLMVFQWFLI